MCIYWLGGKLGKKGSFEKKACVSDRRTPRSKRGPWQRCSRGCYPVAEGAYSVKCSSCLAKPSFKPTLRNAFPLLIWQRQTQNYSSRPTDNSPLSKIQNGGFYWLINVGKDDLYNNDCLKIGLNSNRENLLGSHVWECLFSFSWLRWLVCLIYNSYYASLGFYIPA